MSKPSSAEWLDSYCPNWREKLNLARLRMNNWNDCVFGQLFPTREEFSDAVNSMVARKGSMELFGFARADIETEHHKDIWLIQIRNKDRKEQ